jgi:hypothetical protein
MARIHKHKVATTKTTAASEDDRACSHCQLLQQTIKRLEKDMAQLQAQLDAIEYTTGDEWNCSDDDEWCRDEKDSA